MKAKKARKIGGAKLSKTWRVRDGRAIHDGDCRFWSWSHVCTCGLLHHILPQENKPDWFFDEYSKHEISLDQLESDIRDKLHDQKEDPQ